MRFSPRRHPYVNPRGDCGAKDGGEKPGERHARADGDDGDQRDRLHVRIVRATRTANSYRAEISFACGIRNF